MIDNGEAPIFTVREPSRALMTWATTIADSPLFQNGFDPTHGHGHCQE